MSVQSSPESRLRVSRRGFLKSSGAGVAVAAGSIGAIPFTSSRAFAQQAWDEEHDIVVVGSGGAAFAAAITAHSLGADVVMFEKGAYVGGTTLVSGGTMWTPNNSAMRAAGFTDNREDAIRYMARYSFPASYNPDDEKLGLTDHDYAMISAFYDNASDAMDLIQEAGAATWRVATNGYTGDVQADYMDHLPQNTAPQGRSITTTGKDGGYGGGGELIAGYQAWAEGAGVPIKLGHRVQRVILNDDGAVIGVEVEIAAPVAAGSTPAASLVASPAASPAASQTIAVRARKGVIFGSGGYARNKDMMRNFVSVPFYGGCSAPTNEGDLMRIATAVNAKVGNLHNIWRNEGLFEQAVASETAYNCIWFYNGDSFLMVNKLGKRFVNEKRNYQDRSMAHLAWDSNNADWTNRLAFLIYDGRIQENWGTGFPFPEDPTTSPVVITGETLEDLAAAIRERVDSIKAVTGGVELAADFAETMVAEVAKFNEYAAKGEDPDFQRGAFKYDQETPFPPMVKNPTVTEWPSADQPNTAMYPLRSEGPYYAVIAGASAVDSNGGPVINEHGQILNIDDEPIAGLYGAGNCIACPGVNAYYGAGMTLGLAHAFGYAAAKHAVESNGTSA